MSYLAAARLLLLVWVAVAAADDDDHLGVHHAARTNASGRRKDGIQPFVVGGQDAKTGQFPELVSIQVEVEAGQYYHMCGGFIIDPHWILTAGHCLDQVDPDAVKILAGTTVLSGEGDRMPISGYEIHEDYGVVGGMSLTHDIALINMKEPIQLSETVQVASLQNVPPADGEPAVVAGWGMTSNDNPSVSEKLQWAELAILSNDRCQAILDDAAILDDQVCANSPDGDRAECKGDSGGPLFCDRMVVGIVSWSKKPCGDYPGVFSSIANHYDWIRDTTGLEDL